MQLAALNYDNYMSNKTPKKSAEQLFLEGPRSRWQELVFTLKVFIEFVKGFRKFHFLGPCVTVFGSARFTENHAYYEMTRKVGNSLAQVGFTVMTGGGPGLMELKMHMENRLVVTSHFQLNNMPILIWISG